VKGIFLFMIFYLPSFVLKANLHLIRSAKIITIIFICLPAIQAGVLLFGASSIWCRFLSAFHLGYTSRATLGTLLTFIGNIASGGHIENGKAKDQVNGYLLDVHL
jgi:hypothetical protein